MTKFLFLLFNLSLFINTQSQVNDVISSIENNLTASVQVKGRPVEQWSIQEWMEKDNVPNVSIAVIVNGQVEWAKGYGLANPDTEKMVDAKTLFQAASISKPVAAVGVHRLVQEGKLDLDVDVNTYLTSWVLPVSEFAIDQKVTLRRLMTHTAGTTVQYILISKKLTMICYREQFRH